MKVSFNLPAQDIEFLDKYTREQGLDSRSAALQRAVCLLRTAELSVAYERGWEQWTADGDGQEWDATVADGLLQIDAAVRLHLAL